MLLLHQNLIYITRQKLLSTNENFLALVVTNKNDLLFSVPMSEEIVTLNHLHHSAVFVGSSFAHLEQIVSIK